MSGTAWGAIGTLVTGLLTLLGVVIRARLQQAAAERASQEAERSKLMTALNANTAQTLAIVREELKVQQENNVRFFELLDRNTAALEKLVAGIAAQGAQLGAIAAELSTVKGAVMARETRAA